MRLLTLSVILGLSLYQNASGQPGKIENETWQQKPALHSMSGVYSKESAVIVYDKRRFEYIDNSNTDVAEYYTLHRIIHLNDDQGINSFNKIYLGIDENSDIVEVKARTILPDGRIIELNKGNIKDLTEDDGKVYKIFALEGLEKGCEIEYLYTYKTPTSFFGREVLQSEYSVLESRVEIITPQRLLFEVKPYNTLAGVTDTILNNKRIFSCNINDIAGLNEEKYSNYTANLDRVEFRLSYNNAVQKGVRLFTWNELAKKIYEEYADLSEKESKKVTSLAQSNGWNSLKDEVAKVIAVENYLKKNVAYDEQISGEGNTIEKIMQNKMAGTIGIMRLYTCIYQQLGIKYQIVLTGDRAKFIIDKSFENWDNCNYPIIYFPSEHKFLAPTRPDLRYPFILPSWGATNGLFCKVTTIGTLTTAIGEIKPVELEDYQKSFANIESKIQFNQTLDSLKVDAKHIFGGYNAIGYRDIFNFASSDQRLAESKDLAKAVSGSEHIIFSELKNQELDGSNSNPFIFHSITTSGELIETVGNKLLVKIGLAIGPQTEMYQEKPRKQPVSMEFPHVEERTIDLLIPDGYIVKNLNDLKIGQVYKENGEETMGFVSDYTLSGNDLSIHIMEKYCKPEYAIGQFEDFKRIINASADFNKVVLILEKK